MEKGPGILVAVDFEEPSEYGVEQACMIARLFDAPITLLCVMEQVGLFSRLFSSEENLNRYMDRVRQRFDEVEKLSRDIASRFDVEVSFIVEKGKVYEKILYTARELDSLMIVMGHASQANIRRKGFLGSNAYNVISQAPCPVFITKGFRPYSGFKNILLPLDFTKQTKKQVQKAIEFGSFFQSTMHILSVLENENAVGKLLKQVQMNQVKKALEKNGLTCTTNLVKNDSSSAARVILDHSMLLGCDLIIVMTQQEHKANEYFLGRTAQEIIHASTIPVLSVLPSAIIKHGFFRSVVDPLNLSERI